MTKLWAMRGYSGSGKSVKARGIATATDSVVISRDDIRKMLLGSYWTGKKKDEDRVTVAEEAQVTSLLRAGISVVVDATHLNPHYLRKWSRLATRLDVEFEVIDVHATHEECQRNDSLRQRQVGRSVIDQQFKNFPKDKWPRIEAKPFVIEPVEQDDSLPEAIICDIDGTLAHIPEGGRSPYDYTQVMKDTLDRTVAQILWDFKRATVDKGTVILLSGRDHTCRKDTLGWLNYYSITYDNLFMRDADRVDERGNKLPDYIVKYELFNQHVRGKYNIFYVLDDRKQVVDMWRKLGLKCLQVQDGDF